MRLPPLRPYFRRVSNSREHLLYWVRSMRLPPLRPYFLGVYKGCPRRLIHRHGSGYTEVVIQIDGFQIRVRENSIIVYLVLAGACEH